MADTPSPPSPEILEKLRQLREELAQKAAQQAPKDANTLAWQQSNAFKRIYPRAEGGAIHMEKGGVFKEHVMPFVSRGLDSMFPLRQMMQKAYIKDLWDPVNSAMAQDIPAAVRNMNVTRQDANSAKYHMENAARKSVGMEPLPERYYDPAKALGQINVNEFPNPDNPIKPRSARLWDDIFSNGDYKKSKGGDVDVDRMRLELTLGKKSKGGVAHLAIGGQGPRNWVSGSVDQVLHPLKQRTAVGSDPAETLAEMNQKWTPEAIEQVAQTQPNVREMIPRQKTELEHKVHLNKWIQGNLANYIKKQMATQNDPIRTLAEQGIVHIPTDQVGMNRYKANTHRSTHGGESFGKSEEAKAWEDAADVAIMPTSIEKLHKRFQEPWMEKADPQTKLLHATNDMHAHYLGFDHLVDVLKEDLATGRIRPEQLSKVSIEHAVRRAHEYDQEKKKAMAETALKATEGMPVHKEYPEGYKWIELAPKTPKPKGGGIAAGVGQDMWRKSEEPALTEALKYEGDTMGHCVGGYCPDVLEGNTRIFSLRDVKNEPHVTVEVVPQPIKTWDDVTKSVGKEKAAELHNEFYENAEPEDDNPRALEIFMHNKGVKPNLAIRQIKGKGNAKPKKNYIPYVQDFVKSGNWSDVEDIHNAELQDVKKMTNPTTHQKYLEQGLNVPKYATEKELEDLHNEYLRVAEPRNYKPPAKANGGIIRKAEGGAVNPFDYENPEHVSAVAGHVSKHKDFSKLPDASKHLGELLSSGSYKHLEDPRVQMGLRKAGHNAYYTQEKTGKKLNKMVINKAVGGAVPSMNQMRAELLGKKPVSLSDLSSIGANEAPSMNVKAYIPPSGGQLPVGGVSMGNQPLPIGGIDMSSQGGQQLMPAGMAPPQGAPQAGQPPQGAPQGMPSPLSAGASRPQPPSNILQMTPQGQALNAMTPPQPARMADGGSIPMTYKVGGSDNMPEAQPNWYQDDGEKTFNIDNLQQLAGGGSVGDEDDSTVMTHEHGYADGGMVPEEMEPPKKTVKAYKLFRVHKKHPGKLFPLFVNADKPVEMDKWQQAEIGEMAGKKVKSKIGPLAFRPGWHAGDLPIATHIGEKDEEQKMEQARIRELRNKAVKKHGDKKLANKTYPYPEWTNAPRLRNPNHVWAEVDMPNDKNWQKEADKRGMNAQGKIIAKNAHITDQIPHGGHYRYKTNSNMKGNWLIGGGMKVNRILSDDEVKSINKAAGAKDLPRAKKQKLSDYGFASGGSTTKGYVVHEPKNPHPEVGTRFKAMPQGNLVKRKKFNIEKYENKGSIVGMPYDATTRDNLVTEVAGHQLTNPLLTEAGFDYSMDPRHVKQEIGGASNLGIASRVQGRINKAFEEHGGDVFLAPTTMSDSELVKNYPENFSHHPAHILLDLMKQRQLNPHTIQALNEDLRGQPEVRRNARTGKTEKVFPYVNFLGYDHPNLMEQVMKGGHGLDATAGDLRKKITERLGRVNMQKLLDYNMGDLRAAILDPDIATDPKGFTGRNFIKAKPNAPLTLSRHSAYDTDYGGKYAGGFGKNRPIEIVTPDVFEKIESEIKNIPANKGKSPPSIRAQVIGAMEKRKEGIAQPINARVINNAGLYEEGLKQGEFDPKNLDSVLAYYKRKGGYKKGGKVHVSKDMGIINLELSRRTKKAK